MKVYLDTSALTKLYYPEPESAPLSLWIQGTEQAILFTSLHEVELKNAIGLKVFRGEMSEGEREQLNAAIGIDLRSGVLSRLMPSWGQVFSEALALSQKHTPESGSRSLDILHVAIAVTAGCTHLLTFDHRQRDLAAKTGLEAVSAV